MTRPDWSEFRAALEAADFHPSKTLGQNFLLDGNMARSIVRDAKVQAGDKVLEIGAGCGFLTAHLVEAGAQVTALEIDRRLHAIARDFLASFEACRLLRTDALAGKHALSDELIAALPAGGSWKVVANLPYSISGPLLVLLTRAAHPPDSLTVLVQREVAEKAAAESGSADFGVLAARLHLTYDRVLGRLVPPQLFWPRPRVDSRLLHLRRRAGVSVTLEERERFDRLVDLVFQRRRKTLLATLAGHLGDRERAAAVLAACDVRPSSRPAELSSEQLLRLSRALVGAGDAEP